MTKKKQPAKPRYAGLGLPVLGAGLMVAVLVGILVAVSANAAPGRLPLRTKFLGQYVSHQTPDAALQLLDTAQSNLEARGIHFLYQGKEYILPVTLTDAQDLGLVVNYLGYDRETTADDLANLGHSGNHARDLIDRVRTFYFGATVRPSVDVDADRVASALDDVLGPLEQRAQNARLTVESTVVVQPEKAGSIFPRAPLLAEIQKRLRQEDFSAIPIALQVEYPAVSAQDLAPLVPTAQAALGRGPLTIKTEDKTWTVEPKAFSGWITVKDGKLALDAAQTRAGLADVSTAVAKEVEEPRFTINNGRVAEFRPAAPGQELDFDRMLAVLTATILGDGSREIEVAMRAIEPTGNTGDTNTLGIKELVAEGRTNFAGSPTNRRFNIKVGADKLNGLLIKPGDTFSLVSQLVPIDAKGGYKQELVIKGNRTIPEFGGGLCQIGTTMFRLVMNTGLPVVERRNHSYRVRYYEPPVGKDATIYDPKPDFRFTNDYGSPLLLMTEIAGDDLVFRFYGTKEQRDIVQTAPKLYNIVSPPPTKIIETTDIPVGTTKCLEHAHPGSDASFTYAVTYPGGETKSTVFQSHYRPWQEVCLKGVKAVAKSTSTTNANSSSDDLPN